ncbi:hypothetical protein [Enterococcus casseliflavus]|uniref:hypothetical protein n=1 Tax=Enterococcus TaxID=1350 RepID=UPI003D099652
MSFEEEFQKMVDGLNWKKTEITAEEIAQLSDDELRYSWAGVELTKQEAELIEAEMKKRGLIK